MSILTPEYIKEQAHKPCFWSEEYGFDVVAFTLAMEQVYSNRVGSKINELKKSATRLEAENARLREELAAAQAAVKKYADLLRICRLSNLSQELDAAIDAAMKEVGHE